jgi:hypothetical protein
MPLPPYIEIILLVFIFVLVLVLVIFIVVVLILFLVLTFFFKITLRWENGGPPGLPHSWTYKASHTSVLTCTGYELAVCNRRIP